jgi:hypothetical protein
VTSQLLVEQPLFIRNRFSQFFAYLRSYQSKFVRTEAGLEHPNAIRDGIVQQAAA